MENRKNSKLVFGVGRNDAGYPVNICASVRGKKEILWRCPLYVVWKDMLARCYSQKTQKKHPTYRGCSVVPEWHLFSEFRAWMITQDWQGNQLDKDIILPGNKLYGPESCVFVSGRINLFATDCRTARGEWPIGAYWNKASEKLEAKCRNPFTGKQEVLGYFTDPVEAHEAWRRRKYEHACRYAEQQKDPRIAQALRTRYATPAGELK